MTVPLTCIVLRWPCVADRMLKSNHSLTNLDMWLVKVFCPDNPHVWLGIKNQLLIYLSEYCISRQQTSTHQSNILTASASLIMMPLIRDLFGNIPPYNSTSSNHFSSFIDNNTLDTQLAKTLSLPIMKAILTLVVVLMMKMPLIFYESKQFTKPVQTMVTSFVEDNAFHMGLVKKLVSWRSSQF